MFFGTGSEDKDERVAQIAFGGGRSDGDGAGGASGGISGIAGGLLDGIKGVGANLAENTEDAVKTATVRRLTGYGTLWENGADGGFKPLTMGYAVAAGIAALYLVMRK